MRSLQTRPLAIACGSQCPETAEAKCADKFCKATIERSGSFRASRRECPANQGLFRTAAGSSAEANRAVRAAQLEPPGLKGWQRAVATVQARSAKPAERPCSPLSQSDSHDTAISALPNTLFCLAVISVPQVSTTEVTATIRLLSSGYGMLWRWLGSLHKRSTGMVRNAVDTVAGSCTALGSRFERFLSRRR